MFLCLLVTKSNPFQCFDILTCMVDLVNFCSKIGFIRYKRSKQSYMRRLNFLFFLTAWLHISIILNVGVDKKNKAYVLPFSCLKSTCINNFHKKSVKVLKFLPNFREQKWQEGLISFIIYWPTIHVWSHYFSRGIIPLVHNFVLVTRRKKKKTCKPRNQ